MNGTTAADAPGPTGTRTLVLLGSTGSIGTQTLDIVAANPGRWQVVALAAGGADPQLLARQALDHAVGTVAVADPARGDEVLGHLHALARDRGLPTPQVQVLTGPDAAEKVAGGGADIVLNGITGAIGLRPTLAALAAGSHLALANKESLIIGGRLVTDAAAPGQIVPVDSEHSALYQCLRAGTHAEVRRLVVTASGGPFRGWDAARLGDVTPAMALAHPTWAMGPVITINSATLVNKGLEVIEAHLLFDVPMDRIDVVVHPQSMVHSMVEFVDGSTLAQASPPDMRLPIALGLGLGERVPGAARGLDFTTASTWEFLPLDDDAFPAVSLAREVGSAGGTYPAVYNAANEVCVDAFRAGSLRFDRIVPTVRRAVEAHRAVGAAGASPDVDGVLAADTWARTWTASALADATC